MWINDKVSLSTIKLQEAKKGSYDIKNASDWPDEATRGFEKYPDRWLSYCRGYNMVRIFATRPPETVLVFEVQRLFCELKPWRVVKFGIE